MISASDSDRRPRALMAGRTVYVAGPMRGYPGQNFPAFDRAARLLRRKLGVVPVNPADIDRREFGYDGSSELPAVTVNAMLQRDLREVARADALVLLPGWRLSVGANMEREQALLARVPIWELVGGRFLIPDRGPLYGRGRVQPFQKE